MDFIKIIIIILICLIKGAFLTLFDNVRFSRLLQGFALQQITGISFKDCWVHCEQRKSCKSINYSRRLHFCFLNSENDDGDNSKRLIEEIGFVYKHKKLDPTNIQICGGRSCSEGEVCNNNNKCEVQECPALPAVTPNLQVLGNMFSFGNKVIVKCRKGFIWAPGNEVISIECLDNGTWSSTINCTKETNPVDVLCVMNIDEGGWTVIQKRESASNFYRGWQEYRDGFGDQTNFWLGLKNIHLLTAQGDYELRIDMKKRDGSHAAAKYSNFSVGNESSGFRLFVDGYSFDPTLIDPGESLIEWHNGMKFSTYDNDNDVNTIGANCAKSWQGAWWYKSCHKAHLNGVYENTNSPSGIVWVSWTGWYGTTLSYTRMMIRPKRI